MGNGTLANGPILPRREISAVQQLRQLWGYTCRAFEAARPIGNDPTAAVNPGERQRREDSAMTIAGGAIGNHSSLTHFAPSRRSENFRLAISQGFSPGNLQITPDGNRKHSGLPVRYRVGTLKASRMLHEKGRGTTSLFGCRYQSWLCAAGFAVAIGLAYFMAARLGLALRATTGTSVFWPAAGISVGALIVWGPKGALASGGRRSGRNRCLQSHDRQERLARRRFWRR